MGLRAQHERHGAGRFCYARPARCRIVRWSGDARSQQCDAGRPQLDGGIMSTRKCSLLIGVVLFLSLAANLFLAGWVFGDGGFHRPSPKGMFFESFNRKAESLPEPERSKVKDILDFYQPELKKQMKHVMKTREQADKLFKRNDYSRE